MPIAPSSWSTGRSRGQPPSPSPASAPPMRAEHELVVRCATGAPGETHLRRIRELAEAGVDWAAVVAFATRHWTLPLLYWCLDTAAPVGWAPAVRTTLREAFRTNASHS